MGHSQSSALRNAAEDNAQAQLDVPVNGDLDLEPDLTNAIIHVNESGAIGIGGEPGELIRTDTEDQGSEEADDLFDERVSSSPSIDDGGLFPALRVTAST